MSNVKKMNVIRISENIRYLRERSSMGQSEMSALLGVKRTTISHYESGHTEPSIEKLAILADFFEVSIGDLIEKDFSGVSNLLTPSELRKQKDAIGVDVLNGDKSDGTNVVFRQSKTPFYSLPVSAGERGIIEWYQETPQGYFIDIPALSRAEAAFPISGFSMEPEIRNGDVVGVREMQSWDYVDTAGVYMLITQEERMIKRLKPDEEDDNLFWCLSNNYAPFKLRKTDILRLFKVVACVSVL